MVLEKKTHKLNERFMGLIKQRDSTGARTQDPLLKREMLYQLSYRILFNQSTNHSNFRGANIEV